MTPGDEDLATEFRCYESKRSQYCAGAGGMQTCTLLRLYRAYPSYRLCDLQSEPLLISRFVYCDRWFRHGM
jgi:hypothetical protein